MKKDCTQESVLKKYELAFVSLLAFLFFLLFFYKIHPLVLLDTDDWTYSYMARRAVPQWGAWNPARVLPEVLMPLVTLISKSSLDVFMQNHFAAISLGYAITLSAFIATMVCFLYRLLEKSNSRLVLLLYFLICHF